MFFISNDHWFVDKKAGSFEACRCIRKVAMTKSSSSKSSKLIMIKQKYYAAELQMICLNILAYLPQTNLISTADYMPPKLKLITELESSSFTFFLS
jgi:hypothetical protein